MPLNVDEPGDYWKRLQTSGIRLKMPQRNHFVVTVLHLIFHHAWKIVCPFPVSDDDGRLGYCWMHHFKCHSARTCDTWAKGGQSKMTRFHMIGKNVQT